MNLVGTTTGETAVKPDRMNKEINVSVLEIGWMFIILMNLSSIIMIM